MFSRKYLGIFRGKSSNHKNIRICSNKLIFFFSHFLIKKTKSVWTQMPLQKKTEKTQTIEMCGGERIENKLFQHPKTLSKPSNETPPFESPPANRIIALISSSVAAKPAESI